MFDSSEQGGNGDQQITADDAIFSSLRLWQDSNGDAISQAEENLRIVGNRYRNGLVTIVNLLDAEAERGAILLCALHDLTHIERYPALLAQLHVL